MDGKADGQEWRSSVVVPVFKNKGDAHIDEVKTGLD